MDIIESKTWIEWAITIAKFAFCFVPVLYILLLIPMERRGAGFMQDRQGPNRSYIKIPYFGKIRLLGYVQNMCLCSSGNPVRYRVPLSVRDPVVWTDDL